MSFTCHLYVIRIYDVLACHPYATLMSLVCLRVSSVCLSYVFVLMYSHVTRMYSYLCIRMSLVFVCHPYVTRMHSYVIRIRISLVCSFTMNQHYCKCQFYCNLTECYNLTELYNVLLCFDIIFHDNFC